MVSQSGCVDSMAYSLDVILPNVALSITVQGYTDTICFGDIIEIPIVVTNESYDDIGANLYSNDGDSLQFVQVNDSLFKVIVIPTNSTWSGQHYFDINVYDSRGDDVTSYQSFYIVQMPYVNGIYGTWEPNCIDVSWGGGGNGESLFSIDGGATWSDYHICNVYKWTQYDLICKTTEGNYTCTSDVLETFMITEDGSIETSVKENSELNISIYPNPAEDVLYVEGLKEVQKMEIMNILGEQLFIERASFSTSEKIDLSKYEN